MDGEDFDRHLAESTLLGWIGQIENDKLYKVISGLSDRQKLLLSLRFQCGYTLEETAKILGVSFQAVGASEKRIFAKIKKVLAGR